jgi:hypothetical protein
MIKYYSQSFLTFNTLLFSPISFSFLFAHFTQTPNKNREIKQENKQPKFKNQSYLINQSKNQ